LGVPVQLGKDGITRILKLDLNKSELKALGRSKDAVKKVIDSFKKMKLV